MLLRSSRRTVLALGACVLLLSPLASAAPRGEAIRESPRGKTAWNLADFLGRLTPFWAAIGCRIDPNGACLPAGDQLNIGCRLDPDGVCKSAAARRDIGCSIDPDGACIPGSH